MPDEIKPALTPEEWDDQPSVVGIGFEQVHGIDDPMRVGVSVYVDASTGEKFLSSFNDDAEMLYAIEVRGDKLAQLVAVANHALPDDHPLKITRADVALARDLALYYEFRGTDAYTELLSLAAKLAALLPPEA